MDPSLEDVQFLSRSAHRVAVLEELSAGPREREELRGATGASAPTIGRVLGDFEERGWAVRDGRAYALTEPGAFVAEHFSTLLDRLSTERRLRDVWHMLPGELDRFDLDLVADAVVTTTEPGDPYAPANRCASFYPKTDQLRGFDAALTEPHNFDALAELIRDGLDVEFILPPAVSANLMSSYPESERTMRESDNVTTWWSDELPMYRVIVFDDRVGVGGYDPDSGVLAVYVDSDAPELREWAIDTFERFRQTARRPTPEQFTS